MLHKSSVDPTVRLTAYPPPSLCDVQSGLGPAGITGHYINRFPERNVLYSTSPLKLDSSKSWQRASLRCSDVPL